MNSLEYKYIKGYNNKYYIIIFCSKENTSGYLAINYDFENDKIIDYTFTPRRVLE